MVKRKGKRHFPLLAPGHHETLLFNYQKNQKSNLQKISKKKTGCSQL
jgi:hypothetical protein